MSSADEDYVLEEGEEEEEEDDDDADEVAERQPARSYGAASEGGESGFTSGDSGYNTGATTGDDTDDVSDFFNDDLDPMALLMDMEQCHAGRDDVEQPFELLRSHRAELRAVRRRRDRVADMEEQALEQDEAGPLASREAGDQERGAGRGSRGGRGRGRAGGRGRGRGSSRRSSRSGGDGSVFGASVEDIWNDPLAAKLGMNPRARRGKKSKRKKDRSLKLPEEVSKKLGEANLMYAMSRYKEAVDLLTDVIKEYPNIADPYHTLGLIHEATGNARKALDFHMIAAHLTPKDVGMWKRLAALSTEVGLFRQAIYCLTRVIKRDKSDVDALWDRAVLFAEVNELDKALAQFVEVGKIRAGDPEVPKMVARLYHRQGQYTLAIEALEAHLQRHADTSDLTHINILSELYMEQKKFEQALALIERAERVMCDASSGGEEMPLDLTVKAGMCMAHTGDLEQCDSYLARLQGEPTDQFGDLYLDVGNSFMHMGHYDRAVQYLERLQEHPDSEYNDPALWGRLLICYRALNDLEPAIALFDKKMGEFQEDDPRYFEACVSLAEVLVEADLHDRAREMLAKLDTMVDSSNVDMADASAVPDSLGSVLSGVNNARTALVLRRNKLHLQLGQYDDFVSLATPLMWSSLLQLESDIDFAAADINSADGVAVLPHYLKRALIRRKRLAMQNGRRIGEGASETASVFKGAVKRERRKSHVLLEDQAAEDFLTGLHASGTDAGATSGGGATTGDEGDGGGLSDGGAFQAGAGQIGRATMLKRLTGILAGSSFMQDGMFNMFQTLCRTMLRQGRHLECQSMINKAIGLCSRKSNLVPRAKRDQLLLIAADCLAASGQYTAAIHHLKGVCSRWPSSCSAWSRYCQVSTLAGTVRSWSAQCAIMRKRHPGSLPLMLMLGHVYAITRQHTEALSEYFHAYRFWPKEPLLLLCIGVTYINRATTKKAEDRNRAVLQGFAFLQAYAQHRGSYCSQESLYNMGRAAHQLGLMHIALTYYKRALDSPPPDGDHEVGKGSVGSESTGSTVPLHAYGLQREIAHNMAMLYRHSGADELAREVYRKYCVV